MDTPATITPRDFLMLEYKDLKSKISSQHKQCAQMRYMELVMSLFALSQDEAYQSLKAAMKENNRKNNEKYGRVKVK